MNRSTWMRIGWILGALVVLGLVGTAAFWAGARYSGALVGANGVMPWAMDPGTHGMWNRGVGGMPMAGGFGVFGLFFGGLRLLFFVGGIFLFFALMRRLFFGGWGPRPWGHHGHGPEGFEARARDRFEAWHKEAHGETPPPPPAP